MAKFISRIGITLNNVFIVAVVLWLSIHWGLTTPSEVVSYWYWGISIVVGGTLVQSLGGIKL